MSATTFPVFAKKNLNLYSFCIKNSIKKHRIAVARPRTIRAIITVGLRTWWLLRKYFSEDWLLGSNRCFVFASSIFVNKSVIMKFAVTALFGLSWKIDSLLFLVAEANSDIFTKF